MKKAQIQSMESIVVVIIIGIMIVLGIVFAFSLKSDTINSDVRKQQDLLSFTIALRASSLNELKCSTFAESGNVCLDLYRLLAMEETVNPRNPDAFKHYFKMFKQSEIIVHLVQPEYLENGNRIEKITIYSFEPEDTTASESLFYPVLVYDPYDDINIFGVMEVRTFT